MQNKARHHLSRLRQTLVQLKDQPGKLLPIFLNNRPLVKGTVYTLKRRCGKPTCRCRDGKLHSSPVLTASIEGRTRLHSIAKERLEALRELTRRYQCFRTARADFVKCYVKMVKIIDAIERLRRVKP